MNDSRIIPVDEIRMNVSDKVSENIEFLRDELMIDRCFDIMCRKLCICGIRSALYFVDGFTKNDLVQKMTDFLLSLTGDDSPADSGAFLTSLLPYGEADAQSDMQKVVSEILCGKTVLFLDGLDSAFIIDCRTYPQRSVDEPEKDKTLKGSRDGFVETITNNTALIRRRIRDPHLAMELVQVGKRSLTDVVICYLTDLADEETLRLARERISNIQVDALTMNQQTLAECMFPYRWFNPFPKYKFTERPDTASACILEGNIAILVDNSPSVMILPSSFCDIIEEANDYYFPPITGTYLRLSRMITAILALFFTPTFLLMMQNPERIPECLSFIMINDAANVPFWLQFIILEFSIDGLKLAAVNTPSMLNTPLSIIAGLVLGEYAVSSGWFNAEIMLYMAFVAVANYSQSSFELGYALKFLRIQMIILTAALGTAGYILGVAVVIFAFVTNKTLTGKNYLYPIRPFSFRKLAGRLIRGRKQYQIK